MREYRKFAVKLLEDPSIFVDFLLIFLGQSAGILFLLPKENYPFWVPLISPSLDFLGLSLHNMAEAEEIRHAHQARDLLKRLSRFPGKFLEKAEYEEEEEEEIELSLGLSLNGRFGVDPKRTTTLTRSSSIADCILTTDRGKTAGAAPPSADSSLIRTCSLPAPTEEEWRKRKELQSLRRMEAKRKRIEKLKNLRTVKDRVAVEPNGVCSTPVNAGRGSESQPLSQGSSGSSGISESETPGISKYNEARSPTSIQSLPKQGEAKRGVNHHLGATAEKTGNSAGAVTENPSVKITINNSEAETEAKEMTRRNMMADMPCVSTRGAGPNGKTVEGFLYRYGKGEEVRILCVCHGSFLSPAEFVKHAGGGDVAHPLKHIVVSPTSLL